MKFGCHCHPKVYLDPHKSTRWRMNLGITGLPEPANWFQINSIDASKGEERYVYTSA